MDALVRIALTWAEIQTSLWAVSECPKVVIAGIAFLWIWNN